MAERDDVQHDLETEVPEESAPFGRFYVPEMLDSRLSAQEKCLLWWLRYRCGAQGSSRVSFKTLATDFKTDVRSIRRWTAHLKALGFIKCQQRAMGQTHSKVLTRAATMYPDTLVSANQFLRRDRSEEELVMIRSEHRENPGYDDLQGLDEDLDNTRADIFVPSVDRTNLSAKSGQKCPLRADKNVRSEIYTDKIDKEEIDTHTAASRQQCEEPEKNQLFSTEKERIDLVQQVVPEYVGGEKVVPEYVGGEKRDPRSVDDLRKLAAEEQKVALARAKLEAERREKAAREKEEAGIKAQEQKARRDAKAQAKAERGATANDAEQWWKTNLKDFFPDVPHARWGVREKNLAKTMLADFGDKLRLIFRHVFANWDEYRGQKGQKLPPTPVLAWVYAKRNSLIGEVTINSSSAKVGESKYSDEKPWV